MNTITIFIATGIILIGCTSPSDKITKESNNNSSLLDTTVATSSPKSSLAADSMHVYSPVPEPDAKGKVNFNFLLDCDSLQLWKGRVEGARSDSSLYIMAQCFANKHYDVIVYSKKDIALKDAIDFNRQTIQDKLPGAFYYAYELPKVLPKNPENEFDTYDYVFPSEVKVYKLKNDGWYFTGKQKVNSLEELGRLKLLSFKQK
ncbi:MAG TPA: hypothetical protein VK750_08230 [Cytophagaceae bacterium]|jgi:hypothetical protein|nr:hypothetical protein [Cytophagaceae bacterium]